MRVFVTGGTGLVGSRLLRRLAERKDEAVVLTRRPEAARAKLGTSCTIVAGDPMQTGDWMNAVADCDAVIHLAGENVFARRWSEDFKKLLRDSRVQSTQHVVEALARRPQTAAGQPKVLVNASAIGWYGPHGDEELAESDPPGNDTLARLCVEWEAAAHAAEQHGIRVAIVRVGIVLDKNGGALAQMLTPFKLGVGGKVGSGNQWMSWIHNEDLVSLFLLPLDNTAAAGPLNGTAPHPVTNKQFSKALGSALHRPSFMPTPGFALRIMLGEVAEVITSGQRVLPRRPLELGYTYKFPELGPALQDIFQPATA